MKRALIAGATGLVGHQLLDLLCKDPSYGEVIVITRRPLSLPDGKARNLVVDFDHLRDYADQLAVDDVYCCLGTTMKKAGSREAFRKVDYDFPLTVAQITKDLGAERFLLVSALGANTESTFFYNRVKGEVEQAIAAVGFTAFHIFRPSFLAGNREEKRTGEQFALAVTGLFGFVIPKRYKSIEAGRVAGAMLMAAKETQSGLFVHESDEMQKT